MQPHELRQRLADLDSEISQLDTVPEALEDRRDAILDELDLVKYPVLTLAPEITTEIFIWCKVNTIHNRTISPEFAPLLLTRICRAWRSLALSIPALWDSFPEMDLEYFDPERMAECVGAWFARAATRPLTLAISAPTDAEAPAMQRMVHKYASRLERLRLDVPILEGFPAVSAFPLLSHLTISNLDDMDDILTGEIHLFSADGAPTLYHLSLTGVLPMSLMNMPWTQLTKVSFSSVPLTDTLAALRSATRLVEFRRRFSPEEEEPPTSLVHHPSITSFAIAAYDEDHDILPLLTLPRLDRLELGGLVGEYQDTLDPVVPPFLERVSATVRTFVVGMTPTPPVAWLLPLTQLTTLELVRSKRGPFETDVIRALDRRTSPHTLPNLHTFILSNCGSDRVDDELLGALGSRCDRDEEGGRARLESFRLVWTKTTDDHDDLRAYDSSDPVRRLPLVNVLPLRALAARGLRIHIGTRDVNSFY